MPIRKQMRKLIIFLLIANGLWNFTSCKKAVPTDEPDPVEVSTEGLLSVEQGFLYWNDQATLLFDPSKGIAELKGENGDLYLHMGLITAASAGAQDWKNVISSWTSNDASFKMTKRNDGKYAFTLNPSVLYKLSNGNDVKYLALLVRNGTGTKVGRNKDGSDLYIPVARKEGLAIRFNKPITQPTYLLKTEQENYAVQEEISFEIIANQSGKISLSLDGVQIGVEENSKTLKASYKLTKVGLHNFLARVEANGQQSTQNLEVFVTGTSNVAELPAGVNPNGVSIDRSNNTVTFALTAPQKQSVFLLGDFNQYQASEKYALNKSPDGKTFWIRLTDLNLNQDYTYQFMVDGKLRIADPYSHLVLDPAHDAGIKSSYRSNLPNYPAQAQGIVSVLNLKASSYNWKVSQFNKPNPYDLVIYETLVRDFVQSHDYTTLKDSISYFEKLGVNAIELMPIQESEGNSTWGYNPSFHLALDKYYGTQDELKAFVDACHQKGIAVILDVVLNHAFGQSPMVQLYFENGAPTASNPWFNPVAMHPFNVGYDMNHESNLSQTFVKDVLKYWLSEYKVDGFRFDLSKGFTQKNSGTSESAVGAWSAYDASRVQLWKMYNSYIKTIDPSAYVILEHFADDREEKELAEAGMFLWNNLNHAFNEATMGYNSDNKSDLSRLFAQNRGFSNPNLISYMESHDEERIMFKNLQYGNSSGSYSIKQLPTAIDRNSMAASFLLFAPGPKMIWQFGELGYEISIDQNGRTGEKPIKWEYFNDPIRTKLFKNYAKVIRLKKANPIFRNATLQASSLNSAVKYYLLESAGQKVLIIGNFDVVQQHLNISAAMAGTWHDNLNNQSKTLTTQSGIQLAPGEYFVLSNNKLNY